MTIELDEVDSRLLYTVLIEQAQEHLRFSITSEVAERLYKLASRLQRQSPDLR